ncbi:MAG: hypothetical protein AB1480_11095 [Nitrospirota bacterium]
MRATYDSSKAQRELGFNPKVDVKQGMQLTNEWLNSKSGKGASRWKKEDLSFL